MSGNVGVSLFFPHLNYLSLLWTALMCVHWFLASFDHQLYNVLKRLLDCLEEGWEGNVLLTPRTTGQGFGVSVWVCASTGIFCLLPACTSRSLSFGRMYEIYFSFSNPKAESQKVMILKSLKLSPRT